MTKALIISPRFRELERTIERAADSIRDSSVVIGLALEEIKRTDMWKESGEYASFLDYTQGRWGYKRSYSFELLATANVAKEIGKSTMVDSIPANTRQARELVRAPDPVAAWAEIVEKHEPQEITAAVIREHVQQAQPVPQPEPEGPAVSVISEAREPAGLPAPETASDRILRALEEAIYAALQVATPDVVRQVVREALAAAA